MRRRLTAQWGSWSSDGLRMRFRPRSRIGQLFLFVVPWANFALAMLLFIAVGHRMTLQPGVVFELPSTPFREGLQPGLTAVVLAVDRPGGPATLVFFDDVRYELADAAGAASLRSELARQIGRPGGRELLLLADRRVPHGDVVTLVNLARETGIQRVNVAVKPD